jgi:hypothetical protein
MGPEFAAVVSQAFAPAFGLEETLIPEDALKRRRANAYL